MNTRRSTRRKEKEEGSLVPDGAPDWITEALILETLETWQPYYGGSLTVDDALEILISVTKLFEFIQKP